METIYAMLLKWRQADKHLWAILSFKFEMKMRVAWYTAAAVHRSGCRKSRICVQQMMLWTKHQQLLSTTSKWLSNTYIHPRRLFRNFLHICHTNADFVSAVNTVARWRSGSVLDMRSIGHGFNPSCHAEYNHGQVVNTHVPLSPSSIIWHQPMGSDALELRR